MFLSFGKGLQRSPSETSQPIRCAEMSRTWEYGYGQKLTKDLWTKPSYFMVGDFIVGVFSKHEQAFVGEQTTVQRLLQKRARQ